MGTGSTGRIATARADPVMPPQQRSFDAHDTAILEFKAKLRESTTTAVCGREFVFVQKLTEWLRSEAGNGGYQSSRLLAAAYPDKDQTFWPITREELSDGSECCLLIFSILIELGCGTLIDEFSRREKFDRDLPIDLVWLKDNLEEMRPQNGDADALADQFNTIQWKFCPAKFDLNMSRTFIQNRIVPICRKEAINEKGGTAQLFQIEIPEEFVGRRLREVVKSSRYDHQEGNGPVSIVTPE